MFEHPVSCGRRQYAAKAVIVFAIGIVVKSGPANAMPVSASGEWGPGYGAAQAADGIAHENGNYWQTVQGEDKGAWWQQDLGRVVAVRRVEIAWARYQDKYHCPPARIIVQTSPSGDDGSWKNVRQIIQDEIPRDGQAYDASRQWRYALLIGRQARYVRLLFPDGGQAGAKYVGYICIGEVKVQAPGLEPRVFTIEGKFGRAEVNVDFPQVTALYLRGPDGRLSPQSLLAQSGQRPWARGGYTYVVRRDGKRYESRHVKAERATVKKTDRGTVVQTTGVRLTTGEKHETVATEDWTFAALGEELDWRIVRRWHTDFTYTISGSPGLFFSFDARRLRNSVTSTIWYDPLRIASAKSPLYGIYEMPGRVSENHLQTIRDRDAWAIYKLWTNWHAPSDLRLRVCGGYLYRRGSFAFLSEAGAVTGARMSETRKRGEVDVITLKIAPADKQATGYQLAIRLPDKAAETSLRDFYGSVLNGGAINDQKSFDFGNETDGWYYAGSSWMYGLALAAGVPATGQLSSRPHSAANAFRQHLVHILSVVDNEGRAHFGYNQGGEWVDDNLHTIIGACAYLLHTGDLAFVQQHLPALERMLDYFIKRRDSSGLFRLDSAGAHWYYDAIATSGVNGYYNAFFYRAAKDLAELEEAAGCPEEAAQYRALAEDIKAAFNRVLWKEDAPGGPRYVDWLDSQHQEVTYFCDLCQYPPIAVGIASREQAQKILATADSRIADLAKEYGYQGFASLSALWPVPQSLNPADWQTFGIYMNGGSLLCQTYWEIVARARAGDAEGAYRRLGLFARRAAETSWAGDNAFDIRAQPRGDGEPYLADMVVATASIINGVLGITPTWERLEVTPHLPPSWPGAEADIVYRGRLHRVSIKGNEVAIRPLRQVIEMPLLWEMDANLKANPEGVATSAGIDFGDGSSVALKTIPDDPARYIASGMYQSPPRDWGTTGRPDDLVVAAELHGGRVSAIVQTSDDGFQTLLGWTYIPIKDGVSTYPLRSLRHPARALRVRFELSRGKSAGTTPVIDGFRVSAQMLRAEHHG